MTLIEALEKAVDDQIIQRKYQIENGMMFTLRCKAVVCDVGRFLDFKWGGKIKLDSLKADDWKLAN